MDAIDFRVVHQVALEGTRILASAKFVHNQDEGSTKETTWIAAKFQDFSQLVPARKPSSNWCFETDEPVGLKAGHAQRGVGDSNGRPDKCSGCSGWGRNGSRENNGRLTAGVGYGRLWTNGSRTRTTQKRRKRPGRGYYWWLR